MLHSRQQQLLHASAQTVGQMEGPHLVGVIIGGNGHRLVLHTQVLEKVNGISGVVHEGAHHVEVCAIVAVRVELVVALLLSGEMTVGMGRLPQLLLLARLEGGSALGEHGQAARLGHLLEDDHALASARRLEGRGLPRSSAADDDQVVLSIERHALLLLFSYVPTSPHEMPYYLI